MLVKNKYTRVFIPCLLVLLAVWVAIPKVYLHELLGHDHQGIIITNETKVKSQSTDDDCNFEKYNKPVYFNIFKFIFSFIPVKGQSDDKVSGQSDKLSAVSYAISLLRAPPLAQ